MRGAERHYTAAMVTLGCPMNQVDSERIMSGLVSRGFSIGLEEEADVIVVNTCGFIADACEESVETILSLAELRKTGNLKALVVAGCLAERYSGDLAGQLTEADAIVGLADRENIPDICLNLLGEENHETGRRSRVITGPMHSAYLKIAEGCDNTCTYCAIPKIRGPFRSESPDRLVEDAVEIASLGVRELVLVAQDTSCYGRDLNNTNLADLLMRLNDIEDLAWIRIMYTYLDAVDARLMEAILGLERVVPYLDIPLQHASGPVLKRMGRHGDADSMRRRIRELRSAIDGLVLRTGVIVGFPGETEEDFETLLEFVREMRFERLGAFAYSPEEGTPAYKLPDRIPEDIAQERLDMLMTMQAGISAEFHGSLVGSTFDMIVDDYDEEAGIITGRTYMDAPEVDCTVRIAADSYGGEPFLGVRITGADSYDLTAEIVSSSQPE